MHAADLFGTFNEELITCRLALCYPAYQIKYLLLMFPKWGVYYTVNMMKSLTFDTKCFDVSKPRFSHSIKEKGMICDKNLLLLFSVKKFTLVYVHSESCSLKFLEFSLLIFLVNRTIYRAFHIQIKEKGFICYENPLLLFPVKNFTLVYTHWSCSLKILELSLLMLPVNRTIHHAFHIQKGSISGRTGPVPCDRIWGSVRVVVGSEWELDIWQKILWYSALKSLLSFPHIFSQNSLKSDQIISWHFLNRPYFPSKTAVTNITEYSHQTLYKHKHYDDTHVYSSNQINDVSVRISEVK